MWDRTTRKPDYILMVTVGALVAMGLVMVYSASFVEAFTLHDSQYYYALRQLVGALIGTVGMLLAMRVQYRFLRRYALQIMVFAIIMLVLVLVLPESITTVNSSRSWIRLGGGFFSIQPSEIAKLAIIIYFASWLSHRTTKLGNVTYGLLPFAVMLGFVCGLIMLEPDLGTTMVIVVIASAVYFAAGANLIHIAGALVVGGGAFWLLVYVIGIRNLRIAAFLDPWKYYDGPGYQPIHALYALASGGLFGDGLGLGRQKFQWLPQAHTDAIYAIIGEELGLIGTLLVLAGFVVIAYRGARIAARAPDAFTSLVATGITTWLVLQALLNISVTTSLVPFTGLTLPFLSYGSSSLIMCMVSTGVLLNISRHTVNAPVEEEMDAAPIRRNASLANLAAAAQRAVAPAVRWGYRRARLPSAGGSRRAASWRRR